jgi:hypothetical protein
VLGPFYREPTPRRGAANALQVTLKVLARLFRSPKAEGNEGPAFLQVVSNHTLSRLEYCLGRLRGDPEYLDHNETIPFPAEIPGAEALEGGGYTWEAILKRVAEKLQKLPVMVGHCFPFGMRLRSIARVIIPTTGMITQTSFLSITGCGV